MLAAHSGVTIVVGAGVPVAARRRCSSRTALRRITGFGAVAGVAIVAGNGGMLAAHGGIAIVVGAGVCVAATPQGACGTGSTARLGAGCRVEAVHQCTFIDGAAVTASGVALVGLAAVDVVTHVQVTGVAAARSALRRVSTVHIAAGICGADVAAGRCALGWIGAIYSVTRRERESRCGRK
jgi:hypothetical protein